MSIPEGQQFQNEKPYAMSFKIVILIVVVLFIIAGVFIFYDKNFIKSLWGENQSESVNKNQQYPTAVVIKDVNSEKPAPITNCVGTIQTINGNVIAVKLEKDRNPLSEDKIINVQVDNSTKILRSFYAKALLTQGNRIIFSEPVKGKDEILKDSSMIVELVLADLKSGDSIVARANKNIETSNEFLATQVFLLEK